MVEQYQITGETAAAIVASVETGVRQERLTPDAALPPVRGLAQELGVAAATVASAYRILRQRGVVVTDGRRGTHVRHRSLLRHAAQAGPPAGILDLAQGEPDRQLLPDISTALSGVSAIPAGYRDAAASPELVDVARRRLTNDGVTGRITVTGGALDGIERSLTSQLEPGDAVAVEDPCWANFKDLLASLGLRAVGMAMDDQGPTPQALTAAFAAGVRAIVLTSRAHNPTGGAITAQRAAQLRDIIAEQDDVLVIEDDHWAELSDDPLHLVADASARWIFLRSVSKPYGPDLRVAIACGDEATIAAVEGRMRVGAGWVSTILQHTVVGIWRDPNTATVIKKARNEYRSRRHALLDALQQHGIAATGYTGLNVWIPVADETHMVSALRDAGYAVASGAWFRLDSAPGIRVSVSGLTKARIGPFAAAVAAAWQRSYPLV